METPCMSETTKGALPKPASARCGWLSITRRSIPRAWAAALLLAAKINYTAQTFNEWVKEAREPGAAPS